MRRSKDLTPEQMLDRAHQSRGDYLSLKAQIQAAETARDAALAERYPKLALEGNYGANGVNPAQLHPTFAFIGSVKVNVFDGGQDSRRCGPGGHRDSPA